MKRNDFPSELVHGDSACYDGLLLSTVNCFAAEYDAFMKEEKTYAGFGDVITETFEEAAEKDCYCYEGSQLPVRLIRLAQESLAAHCE